MLNYNDQTITRWEVDEFGNKVSVEILNETKQIIGNKIVLEGMPDEFYRVQINGFTEIDLNQSIVATNQFKVDYRKTGVVYFHPDLDGQTVTINKYFSRGLIYFPASRIWTKIDLGDVTETLDTLTEAAGPALDVISALDTYVDDTIDILDGYSSQKLSQLDAYTITKETQLNTYTNTKQSQLNTYTTAKETQLNTHTNTKQTQLDNYTTTKESQLNTYTTTKETQLNNYTNSKETQLNNYTATKQNEINLNASNKLSDINAAVLNMPYIGINNNWFIWDFDLNSFVDSGVEATGPQGIQGESIEYNWNGTELGIKTENQSSFSYVNLKGAKGDTGEGLKVLGSLANSGQLPGTAELGDAYLINAELWVYDGVAWVNAGSIQGPRGIDAVFVGTNAPDHTLFTMWIDIN